jgi:cytochrome oxidase Cu insertion factor (SCO1/SenC/PrrC family)
MHETVSDGEMMSMRQVERIAVAPGATVRLQPGGAHLMLIDAEVKEGDVVPLRLAFDDGSVVTVDAKVKASVEAKAPITGAPPETLPQAAHVPEFTLTDHTGRPFRSTSLRGKPALLFFGYTHCPDACPTMMSRVARAYREAGAKAHGVPTLFVSVDPRDTPAVLERYLAYFGAVPAKGLTGTKEQIDTVVARFGARYVIRDTGSAAGPLVDHTLSLYLLDRDGKIAKKFGPESDPKEIAKALLDHL